MQKAPYCLLILLIFFSSACFTQTKHYSKTEKISISVFDNFISYINKCIKNKISITDTDGLKETLRYVFTNSKLDMVKTNEMVDLKGLSEEKMENLKTELIDFYRYLQEGKDQKIGENLRAIPIRFSADACFYNKLTSFQQKNTLAFYD
ncbi:MAG: hypothetical protein ABI168_12250, partial [Ginsengibacter sp.]